MKKNVEVIDLSVLLEGLDNKWVVISEDNRRIIAYADEIENLGDKINMGIVMKVPDSRYAFAPTSY
jgi:hypothetical protein